MEKLFFGDADFEVSDFQQRRAIDEIRMVMTAFDCVLSDDSAIYCSSDLTTGKRFYQMLEEYHVRSRSELQQRVGEGAYQNLIDELLRRNIGRSIAFVETVRQQTESPLINPGPFSAPGFTQQHYLYLWEWVIIKKVYEVRFNDGWEYSNGCTLEFVVAASKGIRRLDRLGQELELPEAIKRVEDAIAELQLNGIKADGLQRNLARLNQLLINNDRASDQKQQLEALSSR